MKLIILVLICLLYYFILHSKEKENFVNITFPGNKIKVIKEDFISKNNYFIENELYNFIISTHFTTDYYKMKHELKKCCTGDCKAYVQYLSKNCEENKIKALEMLNKQFNLAFKMEEFNRLVREAEEYYGSAENELDLRKIKLVLNDLKDDTSVYKNILNDTSYIIPGIKKNLYPISVN
jgi:hypothetical protein